MEDSLGLNVRIALVGFYCLDGSKPLHDDELERWLPPTSKGQKDHEHYRADHIDRRVASRVRWGWWLLLEEETVGR